MSETRDTGNESGLDLKALRESKGLTIEAIYNATKVRPAFLEAIESGNFKILPERIYSEAFIKSYAAEIGISPDDILARYRRFLNVPESGKAPEKKADKKAEKRQDEGRAAGAPESKTSEPSREAPAAKSPLDIREKRFSRVTVSIVLTVLVVCGGFLYFLLSDDASGPEVLMKAETPAAPAQPAANGDSKDMKPAEGPQQPAPEQPGAAQPEASDQGAPAVAPAPSAADSNKLIIYANELTWVSVTEDDGQPYEIMLRSGDSFERSAGKFRLDIGNAGGIVINFNGTDLGALGRSGQVVHLVLPQEQPTE